MDIREPLRRRTIHRLGATLAAGLLAIGAPIVFAGPAAAAGGCPAGSFCAFDNINYGVLLIRSSAGYGAKVDVADDRISSGSNRTGNNWVGRSRRTGLPDQTVFTFSPYSDVSWIGSNANDKIDHFDVR
jgi:hypothetical protein